MPKTRLDSTAIVTVTYNSGAHLRHFLQSVRSSEPEPVRVVVADNGSTDVEEARRYCDEFEATFLEIGQNLGYGGAINVAVETLPASFTSVLISNPDIELRPGSLSSLVETLAARPDAGSIGPCVLNSDGSVYPSARRLPSLRTGVGHAVFARVWKSNPWTTRYLSDALQSETTRSAGWLSGSCLLVRRSAFDALGGFDKAFFMYFEDVDLGYRLGKSGWLNLYFPAAMVTHTGAHSTNTDSSKMLQVHHQSAYLYLARKYRGWYLAPIRGGLRAALHVRSWWLTRS
ncbi:glycosyltransferase family 2 protein [Cryobacterium sp. Hb1]|uniref:glycosyltransferase family 2 protein n=1 Tax=Cryobacterium sp. Hb1 TaxID=1259147 RepID=UPI00106C1115|nr:glycosyltransferase family 2 protein [Cryobacterium sp. Hb1]TFD70096.1 glycosyltransferase family 2 protein [Cryobacterium sp. Hb1]